MARYTKPALGLIGLLTLTACGPMGAERPEYLAPSSEVVARDVEAPEVFKMDAMGVWDGTPSLGGVWITHVDAPKNSRAIIRNPANDSFVVGALYQDAPPFGTAEFLVSSDTAAALGMGAGQQTMLNVTALRPTQPEPAPAPAVPTPMGTDTAEVLPHEDPAPIPNTPAPASSSAKVQVGLFSVEANANAAARKLQNAGLSASAKATDLNGKTFWNVTATSANSSLSAAALLTKVKAQGFSDAYLLQK
ncbi:MAG: SPOR domain-containing protein [Planktomarina sp.]